MKILTSAPSGRGWSGIGRMVQFGAADSALRLFGRGKIQIGDFSALKKIGFNFYKQIESLILDLNLEF